MAGNPADLIERAAARLRQLQSAANPAGMPEPVPLQPVQPQPIQLQPIPLQPGPPPLGPPPAGGASPPGPGDLPQLPLPATILPATPPASGAAGAYSAEAQPWPAAAAPAGAAGPILPSVSPATRPGPTPPRAPTGPRQSRMVTLDTARLALAGTVDWSSDRTPVMEELRLIKRRLLRRAFDHAAPQSPTSHLVMITSAKPREGKTFTSTNLAISISQEEDYNVLLVDADIRRQALRQNLGLEANQGFVDLLLNPDLDMADVLLKTNIPRLSVLPAGMMSDRAPELLASSRMRDLIDDMAQRYRDRIIIFDTAPCLVSSDAATLAAHVGQVVFVVEAEQTQQHEIVAALSLISACPDISLVLNKAQPLSSTSYGGYGAY